MCDQFLTCVFTCLLTATGCFYIIAGQHRFEAARQWRDLKGKKREPIGDWAVNFPCTILKEDLDEAEVNHVAGRLQAQSQTVMSMTVSDTMQFFAKLLRRKPKESMTRLLYETYDSTGKTVRDGKPVCAFNMGEVTTITKVLCVWEAVPNPTGCLGKTNGSNVTCFFSSSRF